MHRVFLPLVALMVLVSSVGGGELRRLPYNHPGLAVDLGVGLWAWPLPMDWDEDGDLDLVVSCNDVPYRGIYFFENPGGSHPPVFKPAVRVGQGQANICVSYVVGKARLLAPGQEWIDFRESGFTKTRKIYDTRLPIGEGRTRSDQRKFVDFNGDNVLDLVIGVGYWGDYGWDDAFNQRGEWTRGPLRGFVYVVPNHGSNEQPSYQDPNQLLADGNPIDVYGMPSPNFADFDGDGDLDLICGEFVDSFTYFENIGSRREPRYASGRKLMHNGSPLRMDLCMIVPTAIDWDDDGDVDLVVGQEDGRVALVEHLGVLSGGMPQFAAPEFFQQEAKHVKFGALVTPVGFDWDADGDEDIIAGNTAGYVGFIENLGTATDSSTPTWAAPVRLNAGGETLRIMAGPNGSIQGPCEAKWGYTTLSVADWNHDGLPDLVLNSIWGKVVWCRNTGTRAQPVLAAAQPVQIEWQAAAPRPAWNWWTPGPHEFATQWRTTPVVTDWDGDGLNDLVMLDHEGYLALFRRQRKGDGLVLAPGERLFRGASYDAKHRLISNGDPLLRLNVGEAGRSGRRKLWIVDWDQDGRRDLLVNSVNVNLLRNVSAEGPPWTFEDQGTLGELQLAGHTTCPTTVDWNSDGQPELLVGAEDGYLYYLPRE